MSDFYEFDKLKEKIVLKVINTERNKELLSEVPHLDMEGLNLSVVFYVSLMMGEMSAGRQNCCTVKRREKIMNHVNLRGRLTAAPEIRNYVQKDGATGTVASFTLAVPDRTAKRDEHNNFPADFIRCSCFGKNAEVMEAFSVKGTEIIISAAKLTSSSYEKDGVTVFSTEVTIQSFEFISGTKSKEMPEKEEKSNKK